MKAFDSWWLDVKLGLRMLVKYPGLALSGGVGIAVAVAIATGGLSVFQRNFLASTLPLDEGDRVVAIELWDSLAGKPEPRSLHDFHVWRGALKTIEEVSAYRTLTVNIIAPGVPPESVRVAAMSASGFGLTRVRPLAGRYLAKEDERPGAAAVVVIGEEVWRTRFGGDPAILGRTLQLGATPHAIVGVMPKEFAFPVNHRVWVPLSAGVAAPEPLTGPALGVFGRLAPGATLASARAEVAAVGQRTALAYPQLYAPLRPRVTPYGLAVLNMRGDDDLMGIMAMQGLVVSLLVLVCLNVAILVYTRTAMRQAEIGLRTALGASRGRIVAQLFLEALVLSVAAALTGVLIAALALRQVTAATQQIAADLPYWVSFQLAPEGVLYAGVLSVLAAAIVGVLPGLQATGAEVQAGLRVAGAAGSAMRLGKIWTILIVAQVAFAVAILPPAVLSAWRGLRSGLAGPGFAAGEYLSAQLGMEPEGGFTARQAELMRRLEADPRVAHVTFAMTDAGDERGARIEAQGEPGEVHEVRFNRVAVNFFRAFEVPVRAGRGFAEGDTAAAASAVVVNQPLAQKLYGGQALGKRIRYVNRGESEAGRWYEIVGIVPSFPSGVSAGMDDSDYRVYHAAGVGQVQPAALALRMRAGTPAAFGQALREMAAAVDPELHLSGIRSLDEVLRKEQWIRRLEAGVFLAVTVSVVLLSAAGIYALMSFTVSQRRREIGIRIALGASGRSIVSAIFSRALLQLGAGAAVGSVLGWAATAAFVEGVGRREGPGVVLAVVLVTMTVGMVAAWRPVRQSMGVQPTDALREQ